MIYLVVVCMNKLKELKKYFKDTRIEKAFLKLLAYKQKYKSSIIVAFCDDYITDTEMALLSIYYKSPINLEALCKLIEDDIDYILEG